jgi:predicted ABC-type ATPase
MSEAEKRILIIAGPNGAGKTTFAFEYLRHEAAMKNFINADLIAQGLSPLNPESAAVQAGRIMLQMEESLAAAGQSFAIETTLSGLTYLRRIREWQSQGYKVSLIFLWLPDADWAKSRVGLRVREGGHNIPRDVIERRYRRGWQNFQNVYRSLVDRWILYDNSGSRAVMIEEGRNLR